MKSPIRKKIDEILDQRNAKGKAEYGVTLDEVDPNVYDWKNEVIEELADAVQYSAKYINELESKIARLEEALATEYEKRIMGEDK